jgi:hypothetical protein
MSEPALHEFIRLYCEKMYCKPNDISKVHPNQGDIYIIKSPSKNENSLKGFIIISNSCDIENKKLDYYYSLVPFYSIKSNILKSDFSSKFESKDYGYWYDLITQNDPRSFFLPPIKDIEEKFGFVVEIQQIFSKTIDEIKEILVTPPTLSLKSPFKEQLSYKAGYLFSRIPVDPPEKKVIKKWFSDTIFTNTKVKSSK